jgi:hypothetical protein
VLLVKLHSGVRFRCDSQDNPSAFDSVPRFADRVT